MSIESFYYKQQPTDWLRDTYKQPINVFANLYFSVVVNCMVYYGVTIDMSDFSI
jgi:hypothetical protein